jgi:hypothetical protein
LVVVERVGDLVHYEVRVLEVAEQAVVDFDADVVLVLLQAEAAEEEVLHPMIINLCNHRPLNKNSNLQYPNSG